MSVERGQLLALAMVVATMTYPSGARGQAGAAPADDTFDRGLAAYDGGRYAEAIALFEEAYRRTRAPALIFNIAQASRQMGDCARAVAHYRRFVADAPTSADRPRAERWMAELGDCRGEVATVDLPAVTAAPAAAPSGLPPTLALAPAPQPATTATAALPPQALLVAPSPRERTGRLPSIISFAAAAALAGAGTMEAIETKTASDEMSRLFREGGTWDATAEALDHRGRRAQTLTWIFLGAATAAVATGLFFLLRGGHGPRASGQ